MIEDILNLVPQDISLKDVSRKANLLQEKRRYLKNLEQMIKDVKREIKDLAQDVIPTMMAQSGLTDFGLEDGSRVIIKESVYAHISKANASQAHQWLRDNGYGDLIKNEIVATFGKGEDQQATDLAGYLRQAHGINTAQKTVVHPSTLKSFAEEIVEAADPDFPKELFGVHVVREASVK